MLLHLLNKFRLLTGITRARGDARWGQCIPVKLAQSCALS